jgi:hypothetical protein
MLQPNKENKPEHGELHIFDSAETTTKWLGNQQTKGARMKYYND